MEKEIKILHLIAVFILSPIIIFAQSDWQQYQNEDANITFLIPSKFEITEISDSVSECDFSINFSFEKYSDYVHDSLRVAHEAYLEIKLSKKEYDKHDKENRFYLDHEEWRATPLTLGPDAKADSVKSSDWFGLEAIVLARYYYKEGGKATAAGEAYSFFAIKNLQNSCKAYLHFDNLSATEDSVGQKIISSLQKLK